MICIFHIQLFEATGKYRKNNQYFEVMCITECSAYRPNVNYIKKTMLQSIIQSNSKQVPTW